MKVVIFAGGYGTRLGEHTKSVPKPMVRVGEHPLLWHLMSIYAHYGFNEFVIALGYKKDVIIDYFINYHKLSCDLTVDLTDGSFITHKKHPLNWQITLVDTGLDTMTGGRLHRVKKYLGDEPFFLSYGDGLCDIDIHKELAFHKSHGKIGTVAATHPPPRFGVLEIEDGTISDFTEKTVVTSHWINGGFFIFEPGIFDYLTDDPSMPFERAPLEKLAANHQLVPYLHNGFWHCVDHIGDLNKLNKLYESQQAPWMVWNKKGE